MTIIVTRSILMDGKRIMTMTEFKQWLKKFDADKHGRISKELRNAIYETMTIWPMEEQARDTINRCRWQWLYWWKWDPQPCWVCRQIFGCQNSFYVILCWLYISPGAIECVLLWSNTVPLGIKDFYMLCLLLYNLSCITQFPSLSTLFLVQNTLERWFEREVKNSGKYDSNVGRAVKLHVKRKKNQECTWVFRIIFSKCKQNKWPKKLTWQLGIYYIYTPFLMKRFDVGF